MLYHVHVINRFGVRIGTSEIHCDSDEEAIEKAVRLPGAHGLEIRRAIDNKLLQLGPDAKRQS